MRDISYLGVHYAVGFTMVQTTPKQVFFHTYRLKKHPTAKPSLGAVIVLTQ